MSASRNNRNQQGMEPVLEAALFRIVGGVSEWLSCRGSGRGGAGGTAVTAQRTP